jgi:hypothetical protein
VRNSGRQSGGPENKGWQVAQETLGAERGMTMWSSPNDSATPDSGG